MNVMRLLALLSVVGLTAGVLMAKIDVEKMGMSVLTSFKDRDQKKSFMNFCKKNDVLLDKLVVALNESERIKENNAMQIAICKNLKDEEIKTLAEFLRTPAGVTVRTVIDKYLSDDQREQLHDVFGLGTKKTTLIEISATQTTSNDMTTLTVMMSNLEITSQNNQNN